MLAKWQIDELLPSLRPRLVYGIRSGQFIKVGVTLNMAERLNMMRLSNPHEITVALRRKVIAAYYCEKKMHEVLKDKALGREWFNATIEDVEAAFIVGAAFAKQVYKREVARLSGAKTVPAVDDIAESARRMGLT